MQKSRSERPGGFSLCVAGIPGVGKSRLIAEYIAAKPNDQHVPGSGVVKGLIAPATVEDFDRWPEAKRTEIREAAIQKLRDMRAACPGRLLVDGHFILRNRVTSELEPVFTPGDRAFYDALVLIEAPAEQISRWREADSRRRRPESVEEIRIHQDAERMEAERIAQKMGVQLTIIDDPELTVRARALGRFLDQMCPL